MKKTIGILITLLVASTSFAHDGGHGPKLTDTAKQGGVVSPVIAAKDANIGKKADLVYKAELVRSEDGTVRVYFYDKKMNPLDLSKFEKSIQGIVETMKKKKMSKTPFALKLEDNAFVGKAPKPASKPFNIDVHVKEAGKELLAAFDNLD